MPASLGEGRGNGVRETLVVRGAPLEGTISAQRKLVVEVGLKLHHLSVRVKALIDTGSEANLLRKGLLPPPISDLAPVHDGL